MNKLKKKKLLTAVIIIISSLLFISSFFDFFLSLYHGINNSLTNFVTVFLGITDKFQLEKLSELIHSQYNNIAVSSMLLCLKIIISFSILFIYFITIIKNNTRELMKNKLKLDTITSSIPGGVCCCKNNDQLTISYLSDSFLDLSGYNREEIDVFFENKFIKMVHPSDRIDLLKSISTTNSSLTESQYRIIKKDGEIIWILQKSRNIELTNGEPEYYCVLVDISKIKHTEQELIKSRKALQTANERYRIVSDRSESVIFEYDIINNSIVQNEKFEDLFGYDCHYNDFPYDAVEQELVHPDDCDRFIIFYEQIKKGQKYNEDDFRMMTTGGHYYWYNTRITVIFDEAGTPIRGVGILTNISKKKDVKMRKLLPADINNLTGFLNMPTAQEFSKYIISYNRTDFHAILLLKTDTQNISEICSNKELIQSFFHSLKELFRSSDVIGSSESNTYMFFLKSCSETLVKTKADEILSLISQTSEQHSLSVKVHMGVAFYPDHDVSFEALLKKAQNALNYSEENDMEYSVYDEINDRLLYVK